jgi:hypothetical protein
MPVWMKVKEQARGPLTTPPGLIDLDAAIAFFHSAKEMDKRNVTLWFPGQTFVIYENLDKDAYNKVLMYMKGRGFGE